MVESAFNQMQVQHNIDLGFADGVRALMRQDPDIIMIGEIRDLETAEMAIQAALTGHLVLSTLHTNDAPSAITRMLDLGVPAYLINSTVLGVMAQRLVRTLCPHCKKPMPITEDSGLAGAGRAVEIERAGAAASAGRLSRMPHDRLQRARRHLRDPAELAGDAQAGMRRQCEMAQLREWRRVCQPLKACAPAAHLGRAESGAGLTSLEEACRAIVIKVRMARAAMRGSPDDPNRWRVGPVLFGQRVEPHGMRPGGSRRPSQVAPASSFQCSTLPPGLAIS
jgi:type II secretory ATPase GspE/PulE/Tfp pilus assembly ATPase PilB-like protein